LTHNNRIRVLRQEERLLTLPGRTKRRKIYRSSISAVFLDGIPCRRPRREGEAGERQRYGWKETSLSTGLRLPFSLNRFRAGTIRDLKTPWGQHLDILYRHIPWDSGRYHGALFSISGGVYLPGPAKHHSLHIQAAYEAQRPDNYRFGSEFLFPRGYTYTFHERLAKISIDYSLPLAYPDLALGKIA
jgi:hypothetical protein